MANREAFVTLLCEDIQQEVFVRQWLRSIGFKTHKIRIVRSPRGKGSGEQFVKEQYSIEVRLQRRYSNYRQITLVITIDADTTTVDERHSQLAAQLERSEQKPRSSQEKIALLIPKRNIETWIYYVADNSVNENTIYAKLLNESQCKKDIARFIQNHRNEPLLQDAPPSLQTAWQEIQRIL